MVEVDTTNQEALHVALSIAYPLVGISLLVTIPETVLAYATADAQWHVPWWVDWLSTGTAVITLLLSGVGGYQSDKHLGTTRWAHITGALVQGIPTGALWMPFAVLNILMRITRGTLHGDFLPQIALTLGLYAAAVPISCVIGALIGRIGFAIAVRRAQA